MLLALALDVVPGGKGSNAAVACARQGLSTAVIARLGDDDFGRMALALWARESLDATWVEVAPQERTGVAQISVCDDGDNSIAVALLAGDAVDGEDAIVQLLAVRPDVMPLDLRMPTLDGLHALERIIAEAPAARILLMTM
jgi:sugar/nucleoside kinase (ribokinase family)